jgi:bifunctional DNA-binding transcriptional regulator/antitoxin component of YhaV-PrlF toxin-antitoxin module
MIQTYTTTILQDDQVNATGIPVPKEVIEAFNSGKRPRVIVTLKGFTYRTTVAAFGDVFMMPLSQERREAAGVKAGDTVEITLELDTEPRVVEVPADLAEALAAVPGAREAFDRSSYSARKEFVRQVESAKTPETRARRIQKIVDTLKLANQ